MIERKFVSQNIKEFQIKDYLFHELSRVGMADVKLQRTPLGEKIVITASRPGLVVGKGGSNIARLTRVLKEKFHLENPQIEIEEVLDPRGNAAITAEMIANSLEKFGAARFKGVGHKALATVMASGALGVEILISGKIPSSRAKTWRFYQGYLKKCGDIAITGVDKAQAVAKLKTGIVGIQVSIMPGTTILPDRMVLLDEPITIVEEITGAEETAETESADESQEDKKGKKKSPAKKTEKSDKTAAKKSPAKKTAKKSKSEEIETTEEKTEE
jgi:small subunit ribosomal protein S3